MSNLNGNPLAIIALSTGDDSGDGGSAARVAWRGRRGEGGGDEGGAAMKVAMAAARVAAMAGARGEVDGRGRGRGGGEDSGAVWGQKSRSHSVW